MREWDVASYNRKFAHSIANCGIGNEPPEWRCIHEISQEGAVFLRGEDDPVGQVVFECKGAPLLAEMPIVEFNYTPIEAGMYAYKNSKDLFFILQRRHLKSFKIGLTSEGYEIFEIAPGGGVTRRDYRAAIDLTKPLTQAKFKKHHILNSNLVVDGKTLRAYGTTIGFLDAGRAILKDPAFKPLVKPYLGDAWEIVDL